MRGLSSPKILVGLVAIAGLLVAGYLGLSSGWGAGAPLPEGVSDLKVKDIPFDGKQAYEYLKQVCAIGPRQSGSAGMVKQQKLISDHFTKLGGDVSFQEFQARDPQNGENVPMANLIVHWHPDRKERILLCTHYDTRPFPDQDKRNPKGVFIGADDGASGVAVLMELARSMPKLESKYGVDFVLFDGEEYVFEDRPWPKKGDPYFLGAEYFARMYAGSPPDYKYRWGVLLDMVGNSDLKIYQEFNSMSWRDTRPLVEDIWRTAYKMGVREFIPHRKHEVLDDHLRLHDLGHIPTCDIIDFDYPYWHTEQDTPAHCSALSLAKVGWVMLEWLKQAK